jgi:hypothetical protein
MIKNMTIEQLSKAETSEEVEEGMRILLKRLNELETDPKAYHNLSILRNMGRVSHEIHLAEEDEEELEENYFELGGLDKEK